MTNIFASLLTLLVFLAASVYLINVAVVPQVDRNQPTPTPVILPTATASPVASAQNIVVDSSGCDNPNATLTAPTTNLARGSRSRTNERCHWTTPDRARLGPNNGQYRPGRTKREQ